MKRIISHPMSIFLIIWLLFSNLSSCGNSGGGNDDGASEDSPAIEYSGLTTPVTVTSANAKTIAIGSLLGLSPDATIDLGEQNLSINRLYAIYFSLCILRTTQKVDISNLNSPQTPTGIRTETGTISGNCNGTGAWVLNINDIAETYDGTFIFSQYCEDHIAITGETKISGTIDLYRGKIKTIAYVFENLSIDEFSCRGEVYIDLSGATQIVTFDLLLKDSRSGKVHWAKDYSIVINAITATDYQIEVSGAYYNPDQGYANISTLDPLLISTEDYPLWGLALCLGDKNTKIKLTSLNSYSFKIDADTQGDDDYDYTSGILIWPGASPGPWQKRAPLPTWQPGSAAASVEGKIYVMGGQRRSNTDDPVDTVQEYSPTANKWNVRTPMPTPRYWLATAVVNGKVYAIGGSKYPGTWIDGPQPVQALNVVEEYNPATDTWITRPNMPNKRMRHSAAAVNGKIYVIGGVLNNNPGPWVATGLVEEFDPATDSWQEKSSATTISGGHEVVVVDDKIYLIGGYLETDNGMNVIEKYDPLSDTWSTETTIPTNRVLPAAGVISDEIYLIGGRTVYQSYSLNEKYIPAIDTWVLKTSMPVSGGCTAGIAVNDKIYVIGAANFQTIYEYDPALDP